MNKDKIFTNGMAIALTVFLIVATGSIVWGSIYSPFTKIVSDSAAWAMISLFTFETCLCWVMAWYMWKESHKRKPHQFPLKSREEKIKDEKRDEINN